MFSLLVCFPLQCFDVGGSDELSLECHLILIELSLNVLIELSLNCYWIVTQFKHNLMIIQ